jgi:uncharacterized membrane protein YhaH (DUF805 family)
MRRISSAAARKFVQRLEPIRLGQRAEIAARRTAGIRHEDVGVGTGGEHGLAAGSARDVRDQDRRPRGAALRDAAGGLVQRRLAARDQRDAAAFLRERLGASVTKPLRRAEHECATAGDAEIHGVPPEIRCSKQRPSRAGDIGRNCPTSGLCTTRKQHSRNIRQDRAMPAPDAFLDGFVTAIEGNAVTSPEAAMSQYAYGESAASWRDETPPSLSTLLFSFEGRIRRSTYWGASILSAIAIGIAIFAVAALVSPIPAFLLVPVAWWIGLALSAKRLHDRNLSGWMIVPLSILPGVLTYFPTTNPFFWVGLAMGLVGLVVMGFLPGTEGENEYGPDPRASDW